MWSLLKGVVFLSFVALFGALVFFAPLGGETLAEHAVDVWRAPVLQDKLAAVREDVKGGLVSRLTALAEEQAKEGGKQLEAIADADKRHLETLLRRVQ